MVKQSASDKRRDSLTSYELNFLSDYVSIVKFKSQNVWRRSVDICGDGKGKTLRRGGFHPLSLPAEIGLSKIFAYFSQFLPDLSLIILISRDHGCQF